MKTWLKNSKNEVIIDILKNYSTKSKLYKVPNVIDKQIRINFRKISKGIKSK